MTLIAWPATLMWGALRRMGSEALDLDFRAAMAFLMIAPFFAPLAALFTISGRIVARHRELAADRAAAVLTGSPAGVSAALLAVGEGLVRLPRKDLRSVAARDPFHFVPARPARGLRRLWATHPPVDRRLRELDRLERLLQVG